jgi:hypothetical protein
MIRSVPALLTVFFVALAFVSQLHGQIRAGGLEDRRVMTAHRMNDGESIELDGVLDEAAWGRAVPASEFIQVDPVNGVPPTEPTEVTIVYNENNLYMGVMAYDSDPNGMRGNTMLRDAFLSADDRFMWVFDTYLDARTGYFFEINPSGAMGDALLQNGGSENVREWDGIWTAKIVQTDIGWIAEIEIPFRTLNFDPNNESWGINFQRTVRRKAEESVWTGYERNTNLRTLSNAGLVTGLSDISQGVGLDIRPYVVGSASHDAHIANVNQRNDFSGASGVDFIYNITPSLRADFTINTDFAETEVDERQVNLTRFPLRFPEKRQFFLEGRNFFGLSGYDDAYFSRRIGLNDGRPQRVDYGAKVTGQIGAFDVGMLQVRTGELKPSNEGDRILGEDFTVFRGRRRLLNESHVGMLYTHRGARASEDPMAQLSPGEDLHTVAVDFRLATSSFRGDQNLAFQSHYINTTNPDGTGKAARYGAEIDYPNDRFAARVRFEETQENFDPAVGFVFRRGIKNLNALALWAPRPESHPLIRQLEFSVEYDGTSDSRNVLLSRAINITAFQFNTHADDRFSFAISPQHERLQSEFQMNRFRQGQSPVVLPVGSQYDFTRYTVSGQTSNRRPLAVSGDVSWGNYFSGTRSDYSPTITIRPRNGLIIDAGGQWSRIELPEGSFSTSVFRSTISSQFGPWVSLSSNVQYDTVSRIIGWQARFRWILSPGNDLYLVYTHNWESDPAGFIDTANNKLASKFVYTHRF